MDRQNPRFRIRRRLALGALLGSLLWGGGCDRPPERPELEALPEVNLERLQGVDETARRSLSEQRQRTLDLVGSTATNGELAVSYGHLGRLYHAYGLLDAAAVSYGNARRLAPKTFDWAYYQGLASRQRGDLAAAEEGFAAALALRPQDGAALVRQGNLYLEQNRPDAAEPLFQRLLDSGDVAYAAAAHHGLGQAAAARGDQEAAVEHFLAALEADPEATGVYYPLAQASRRAGRPEEAERYLRLGGGPGEVAFPDPLAEALDELADTAAALQRRGGKALVAGQLDEAEALYRRAVVAAPDDVEARRGLALALTRLERPEAAAEQLREGLARDPDNAWLLFDLGNAYLAEGKKAEAEDAFRKAVASAPDFDSAHFSLANVLMSENRWREAQEHLEEVLQLKPNDTRARYQLAMSRYQQGDQLQGLTQLEALLAEEPDFDPARQSLASILGQRGDLEAATEQYDQLVRRAESAEKKAALHLELASLAARARKVDLAIERLRLAAEATPRSLAPHVQRGSLLQQLGRMDEAVDAYAEAVALDPTSADAWGRQASALMAAGRHGEARRLLEQSLQVIPGHGGLAHTLARLLATAPDPAVRNGNMALTIANRLYQAQRSLDHAETVGMALAENGNFSEAVQWQQGLVSQARGMGNTAVFQRLNRNLERYRRGEAARME